MIETRLVKRYFVLINGRKKSFGSKRSAAKAKAKEQFSELIMQHMTFKAPPEDGNYDRNYVLEEWRQIAREKFGICDVYQYRAEIARRMRVILKESN